MGCHTKKMGWGNRKTGIGRQKFDTCLTQGLQSLFGSALQEAGDEYQNQDPHLGVKDESGSRAPPLEIWNWSILSSLYVRQFQLTAEEA